MYWIVRKITRIRPRKPRAIASQYTHPPSLRSDTTTGSTITWALAVPANAISATTAVATTTDSFRGTFIAADTSTGGRGADGGGRREPEMGFEPMTYHLRGGCSAWLSYSGEGPMPWWTTVHAS